jgi:signal transduction histidine kinase
LLEDLLDLSRLAADNLELSEQPVDVGDELAQAAALCGPLADERALTLSVEPGERPLWALADRRRLKQVLLNLISNAVKFNRAGGSVTVLAVPEGDDRVRIDVIDTGVGIPADQLPRAFAPFERLDASRHGIEGNGLGLAVSRALANAMGGSLDVASTPGIGSVFSLRLRAANAAEEQTAPRSDTTRVLSRAV